MSTWEEQVIGRKFPAFHGENGIELDPAMMPQELVREWEIEGKEGDDEFVFSVKPLSGYRSNVVMAIEVTTDADFKITGVNLTDSYGFPDCMGHGRPWSVDLNNRELQQVGRLLKGMVGLIPQKAVCTGSQGPWFR